MSWGLEALGLDASADERAVKRAYAARLRHTRPDDDPEAFQQLHGAYQAALEWLRWQQHEEDDDAADDAGPDTHTALDAGTGQPWPATGETTAAPLPLRDPGPPPIPGSAHEAMAAPLSEAAVEAIVQRVLERAQDVQAPAFAEWLQAQPELWSLHDRPRIGQSLFLHLRNQPLALPDSVFEALAECFGWNDIVAGIDAMELQTMARHCRQAWLLSTAGRTDLATRVAWRQGSVTRPDMAPVLARLRQPRSRWRNLLSALHWQRPDVTVWTLVALDYWPYRQLPPTLSAVQVEFWARFGVSSDPLRRRMASLRSLLVGLLLGLICVYGVASSWPLPDRAGMSGGQRAALIIAVGTLLVPGGWALFCGVRRLLAWHQRGIGGQDWYRHLLVPALAAVVTGLLLWVPRLDLGTFQQLLLTRPLLYLTLLLAMIGYHGQRALAGHTGEHPLDRVLIGVSLVFPWLGVAATLGYWLLETVARRRR